MIHMSHHENMVAFGPVPSRRLGRSLGINNIPAKTCSYSCVYCQLGITTRLTVERSLFYEPRNIFTDIEERVSRSRMNNESIDYLAFVPDGEPTLDLNLGKEIEILKSLGLKVAVLTNGSIIDRCDVRDELSRADLVSLKVDAVSEDIWRKVNRPHKSLNLHNILKGMCDFTRIFDGQIISETMLLEGLNDNEREIRNIAKFLEELNPRKVYVAIPTRPPAERWVRAADERKINLMHQILAASIGEDRVECLIGYEGDYFTSTCCFEDDLLRITSVHPMRREAVEHMLRETGGDWSIVEGLVERGMLIKIRYGEHEFYMRKIPSRYLER